MSINKTQPLSEHVRATWDLLAHQTPVEMRIIPKNGHPYVTTVATEQEFINVCNQWDGKAQIYCGVRERKAGFLDSKPKGSGGDANDVSAVTLTVVDIDAVRAEGFAKQAATDAELAFALTASEHHAKWHESQGFLRPARAMSGNGVQLWFAIPRWEVNESNRTVIPERLKAFEQECRDALPPELRDKVSIDSIHDLPRIIKVIGTTSVKGDNTPDRPHRASHWIDDDRSPILIGRQEDAKFGEYLKTMQPSQPQAQQQAISLTQASATPAQTNQQPTSTVTSPPPFPMPPMPPSPPTPPTKAPQQAGVPAPQSTLPWTECAFLRHCWDDATSLPEPQWYAMLSNLNRFGNEGRTLAHQLSAPYPNYTTAETDKKLLHAFHASGPITCKEIATLGFRCPLLTMCRAKAPAGLLHHLIYAEATQAEGYAFEEKEEGPSAGEIATEFLSSHFSTNDAWTLRYYRGDWWRWNGRNYKELPDTDFRAIVRAFTDDETSRKGSTSFTSSIIESISGKCLVPADTELPAWVGDSFNAQPAGRVISFSNGILDLDALLRGENVDLQPHTPKLFTPVALPYPFDPKADCPDFIAFLNHNLEGDQERIAVLQEFVGLCLVYDTRFRKFLFMEGQSETGRSTCTGIITALLGEENVSHVPLEEFGQRFALSATLGKLANIASEVGELDYVAEGIFKQFTAGDRMDFERKYREKIEARPTARVIFASNHRPRFLDRTEGIWNRIILIQWNKVIPKASQDRFLQERIKRNELSGVFLWALAGLARLMEQGRFTEAKAITDAIADYKLESNPARAFLVENYEVDTTGAAEVINLYEDYAQWCKDFGYQPLSNGNFGKELKRIFPKVEHTQKRNSLGTRYYSYSGLKPKP